VLLAPTAVLVSATYADDHPVSGYPHRGPGAPVQFLGLIRWPFAVPNLSRTVADPGATAASKDATDVAFQTLNRYLGVAVGEHLGYFFNGL
jgi:hypothetical protein